MTSIPKKRYFSLPNEFSKADHKIFTNLIIRPDVGFQERIVAIIKELRYAFSLEKITCYSCSHGGFIPINISHVFKNIVLKNTDFMHSANIKKNMEEFGISNIFFDNETTKLNSVEKEMLFLNDNIRNLEFEKDKTPVVFSCHYENHSFLSSQYKYSYSVSYSSWRIYISDEYNQIFSDYFSTFLSKETGDLFYDNLVHFCMIVKNGGEQLEEMLKLNMPNFDEWTIVDTGSTDDTVKIIEKTLVGKKRGKLYHYPFTNFRDTRNLCLDLAEKQSLVPCKYLMMLDDTYVVCGDLRKFLMEVRGDQIADSYSMYVTTDDTKYASNRILRTETRLRYKHKIHEVLNDENNVNVIMFEENANILDRRFPYMETRTMERKRQDLEWLLEEIRDHPTEPRHYYYLAQTYNLLGEHQKAFEAFQKRVEFKNSGFIQERVDAAFESARIANFQLKKTWDECLKLYETAWRIDESRPESLYFIGIHYFLEEQYSKAYPYFKKAYELGFPAHCQHSLKPTLSFHFLPIFLTKTCYFMKDWVLGLDSAQFFLKHNKEGDESFEEMVSWMKIFAHLVQYSVCPDVSPFSLSINEKPILCFLADGGFEEWSGKTILTKGVGGSETYIIEMARNIQKLGYFQVVVFCRCSVAENFEDVIYRPLNEWYSFIKTNYIHTCIISRFTEYIPTAVLSYIENIHVVLHDLIIPGTVIINHQKIKKVFCLTEWHCKYVKEIFPILEDKIVTFSYGINSEAFPSTLIVPYSFIYSSFPDRGLLPLLQIWSKIIEIQPKASLNIFCNLEGEWVNRVQPEQMALIRRFLTNAPNHYNIRLHGWTDKQTLFQYWAKTDIWFYPCIFKETFCMTALEAAASRTFVFTNDLAALQNTVGNRGIVITGDAFTPEWQERALNMLFPYLQEPVSNDNLLIKNNLLNENAKWASELSWFSQAEKLCQQHILTEVYEYRGLYNWTNGLPTPQDRDIFLQVIRNFTEKYRQKGLPISILEIGTWTGISLINLLQEMPSAIATVIDTWTDYEEIGSLIKVEKMGVMNAFKKNIYKAQLNHRVRIRKGDSEIILQDLIREGQDFDFIYVNGSHLLLETYSDCILSWSLLNKGGVMVIDDYLFESDNELLSYLEKPKNAIDHFLKKKKGEYNLLHIGYRVFLEKN